MSKDAAQTAVVDDRARWRALPVLCFGVLVVTINGTIVNVALPAIRSALRFSDTSLIWVANSYLAAFAGFLLLGGRLGDLFGHRRLFSCGIALVALASLGCGLATLPGMLIASRCLQGVGGAIVSAVTLSLIAHLFADANSKAKALGIYAFVTAAGGSVGVLLGGVLTSGFNWRAIFLLNVPVGIVVFVLSLMLLPRAENRKHRGRLDVAGTVTATSSLLLASYAIVSGRQMGWNSATTLVMLTLSGVLLVLFVAIEARVRTPLMPLALFRIRSVAVANVTGALLAAAVLSWSFVSALYLQRVLGFNSFQAALALLPASMTIALMSLAVAPVLVLRFGVKRPLVVGLLISGVGLALLARAPLNASFVRDVLPGTFLVGLGTGMAFNPLLLSALSGVASSDSGAASGMFNTAYTMGGVLGLSILASIAASRTDSLISSGAGLPLALHSGYSVAFYSGAFLTLLAALVSVAFLRPERHRRARDPEDAGSKISRCLRSDDVPSGERPA